MTTAIAEEVARFVAIKQKLGYRFTTDARTLLNFARFAAHRNEAFIRSGTALEWASEAASQRQRVRRLHSVHRFARWLHAEDARHEVPPRDALGHPPRRRPKPHLISIQDIKKLLTAALSMPPVGTIAPLTWHYLFGLVAATGLRIGEARALTLDDITPDGLIVRDAKFGKSRMVALHPTTRDALNRYLVARRSETTLDGHLFVLGTGRPPSQTRVSAVFLELAEQTGIREPGATRGPSLHSLPPYCLPAALAFAHLARSALRRFSPQCRHKVRSGAGLAFPHLGHMPRAIRSAVMRSYRRRPHARSFSGSLYGMFLPSAVVVLTKDVRPDVPGDRRSAILAVHEQGRCAIPPILNAEGGAVDARADDDLVALGPHPLDGAQGDDLAGSLAPALLR